MALFGALFTVGMTLVGVWRTAVGPVFTMPDEPPITAQAQPQLDVGRLDYCAGGNHLVLRREMRWTDDGEWWCLACAPTSLADEIIAAGNALDGRNSGVAETCSHYYGGAGGDGWLRCVKCGSEPPVDWPTRAATDRDSGSPR